MKNDNRLEKTTEARPRIAIITNHGYAGVDIPVGGAPDTGGQNFYVNSKALTLEKLGLDVTIFTRGGFPFFESDKIREGIEQLSEHVRYVYVPGGEPEFIRKENISVALKEEVIWIYKFIESEAHEHGIHPWDYYECIDTHYWDAGVIGVMLMERWQNQVTYNFIKEFENGLFKKELVAGFKGHLKHKRCLFREVQYHFGAIARATFPGMESEDIIKKISPVPVIEGSLKHAENTPLTYRELEENFLLGRVLVRNLRVNDKTLNHLYRETNRHIWTPHSTSIIKERNYWARDAGSIRHLHFLDRGNHEKYVCRNSPLFCSSSPEVWRTLCSFHRRPMTHIFDFPPCLDTVQFRPREKEELGDVYTYLSEQSGVDVEKLKAGRIIFESSRMDHTKRKDLLLHAFEKIARETDDTYLFIGGGPKSSPIYQELEQLQSTNSAKERTCLLGYIPDEFIDKIFSVPTVFVSASEMEGFGMSVSQAAAAKVAIVSSDLIPFATQFAPDHSVIVEHGNIEGFADAVLDLLANPEKRQANAQGLYEVAQQLNWENTCKEYLTWYRNYFQHIIHLHESH